MTSRQAVCVCVCRILLVSTPTVRALREVVLRA